MQLNIKLSYSIFLILLLLSNPVSLLARYDTFPIPEKLIGFREWNNHQSSFRIGKLPYNSKGNIVTLNLSSRQAKEVMISRYPTFLESSWKPYSPKIQWNLDDKTNPNKESSSIRTLYVVFKHFNSLKNRFEISPILHDTVDIDRPSHKIVKTANGYMNWSTTSLHIILQDRKPQTKEYQLKEMQVENEEKIKKLMFKYLLQIPVFPNLMIENLLYSQTKKQNQLKKYLDHLTLVQVYFPRLNQIVMEKKIDFFSEDSKENSLSLYQFINPDFIPIKNPESTPTGDDYYNNEPIKISALVIDTRGENFSPSLFIKIINQKNKVILNSHPFNSSKVPYLRYFRDSEGIVYPKDTLITAAYDIDKKNSTIKLIDKYAQALISDPENLVKVANGNIFILVD